MSYPYPYPQTAGRDRHIDLVDQSTFAGLPYRPTSTQAESLFTTSVYAENDWYGTPYALQFSEQANVEESRAKAALIGGESSGGFFEDLWGNIKEETAKTFKSIGDVLEETYKLGVQSVTLGSPVPGSPPAPGEINLTAARREQIIKDRIGAAEGIFDSVVAQVKGLFNMGYPSSVPTPEEMGYPMEPGDPIRGWDKGLPIEKIAVAVLIYLMVTR